MITFISGLVVGSIISWLFFTKRLKDTTTALNRATKGLQASSDILKQAASAIEQQAGVIANLRTQVSRQPDISSVAVGDLLN